jgi:hypothetical protein
LAGITVRSGKILKDDVRKLIAYNKAVAVKLDGHGKDFSKEDVEDMRDALLWLGFKKAEIAAMDDQDIIGTWQAETGYVESDD